MKQKTVLICVVAIFTGFFFSCKVDDSAPLTKEKITGYIQKGPFLNGTSIYISELNPDLSQTGKIFSSQIKDNQGTFELSNVQLSSPLVELKANGFYFNEVTGLGSNSQLTLTALSNVSNKSTLNVNVLSTLEKARVEKLIAGGISFNDAKKKAMEEILAVFSINKSDIQDSELLDLNKSGDDNAILLAISVILQGFRSEAQLSELMANMSGDISDNGKLDDVTIGTSLISHAKYLDQAKIRENLVKRFSEIGATIQIPAFEKYLNQFIENSTFKSVDLISYPESYAGAVNLLNDKNSDFPASFNLASQSGDIYYCLSANTFKGLSLKIKIEFVEGVKEPQGYWYYQVLPVSNWVATDYDFTNHVQIFSVVESGKPANVKMLFPIGDGLKIRLSYFENNDLVPTRTRIITFK